jgi:hypothetical protein
MIKKVHVKLFFSAISFELTGAKVTVRFLDREPRTGQNMPDETVRCQIALLRRLQTPGAALFSSQRLTTKWRNCLRLKASTS